MAIETSFKKNIILSKTDRQQTVRRLLKYLFINPLMTGLLCIFAISGITLLTIAPLIFGKAINVLFAGLISGALRAHGFTASMSKEEIIHILQERHQSALASVLSTLPVNLNQPMDWHLFGMLLLIVVALYVSSLILRSIQSLVLARIVSQAVTQMRTEIEDKIHRLPLKFFDTTPHGEVMNTTTNDVDNITSSLQQVLGSFIFSTIFFLTSVAMMIYVSPLLSLISVGAIVITAVIAVILMRQAQKHFTSQWNAMGNVESTVEEMITGHFIVRAYSQEETAKKKFDQLNETFKNSSRNADEVSGLMTPIATFIGNSVFVIVVVVGALRILRGELSLGSFQAFIQYTRNSWSFVGQISSMSTQFQSTLASAHRVFLFLDEPEELPDSKNPEIIPTDKEGHIKGDVNFDKVYFSYNPQEPLIQDLTIRANPGNIVAIVGPTGAGKTTIINLLMRFYDIQKGIISIDGTNTLKDTRADVRSHCGMVLQDAWLFNGTIKENLLFGVPEDHPISDAEFDQAVRSLHVHDFVSRLPHQYDTLIDTDNMILSQGECQLLTICRTFLTHPDILILDEATSSVDTRTEQLVQEAMKTLRAGKTSFIIAHRLSTIRDADLVLVIDHGKIVESGTQKELLELGGEYHKLYASQRV